MTPPPTAPDRNDRGNALGFWFFRTALRWFGLRGAYGLLYMVCAYYALVDRRANAAAAAYLRRRFPGRSRGVYRWLAYRLFINQGKCLIDRHAFNVGCVRFQFDTQGCAEIFRRLGDSPAGFILLLSHAGGWQLALPHLRQGTRDRPVALLMHAAETPEVRRNVRGDDAGFQVISPELGPAAAVEMVVRLERGEIVAVMGDRAYGGQAAEAVFLGDAARFPASAFAVARAAQCPVLALFVPKTGVRSYAIEAALFEPPARTDRASIRQGIHLYAAALENFVQRHPLQCFLFADIWRPDGA